MASKFSLFLAELKRRKVTRVAVVYALVGLGLIEGASMILPTLQLEAGYPYIVIFVLFGFPVALVLAWALEVTPEGIQRTLDLSPKQRASQTSERWSARSWILTGVGLLVIGVGGYFVLHEGVEEPPPRETKVSAALPDDYVAVFPFQNLTGDPGLMDLGTAAAHMLTDGFSRADEIRGVATNTVEQSLRSLGEGAPALDAAATLGVGIAITGVITKQGDSLQLRAQITRVETGEVFQSVDAAGAIERPMMVLDALQERVAGALAVSIDGALGTTFGGFVASPTPSYDAYREHRRGLETFDDRDYVGALRHFHRAFELDSTFYDPLLGLAYSYEQIGQLVRVDSVLKILEVHREELTPNGQLSLDLSSAWLAGDREGELRAMRALVARDPISFGFQMVDEALYAGRPAEALQALEGLDFDRGGMAGGAPNWVNSVRALHLAGRFDEALEAAHHGQERFPEHLGLRHLEARTLIAKGRLDEVGPLLAAVESMEPDAEWTPGGIIRQVGVYFARYGHPEESRALAERALDWFQARDTDEYSLQGGLALLLAEKPEEALAVFGALIGENPESQSLHGRHGIALALSGNPEGAEADARWLEELDRPFLHGEHTYWRAAILAHLGRRDESVRQLRRAFQEGRPYRYYTSSDLNFRPLWGFEPYEQLIAPKG